MRWLVEGARADDALFVHCEWTEHQNMLAFDVNHTIDSGHGGRTRDMDGDELDGWDEGGAV